MYNNSDYAVSADKKKVVVDKATNTRTEIVDMSSDAKLAARPLLKQKAGLMVRLLRQEKYLNRKTRENFLAKQLLLMQDMAILKQELTPAH